MLSALAVWIEDSGELCPRDRERGKERERESLFWPLLKIYCLLHSRLLSTLVFYGMISPPSLHVLYSSRLFASLLHCAALRTGVVQLTGCGCWVLKGGPAHYGLVPANAKCTTSSPVLRVFFENRDSVHSSAENLFLVLHYCCCRCCCSC